MTSSSDSEPTQPSSPDENEQIDDAAPPFQIALPDEGTDRDRYLWMGLLVLLTMLAYVPVMVNGQFLQTWDDNRHVTQNELLRSGAGLREIWTGVLNVETYSPPQYYPMTHTIFWLEYKLWELNPLGYHVVNVLLHAAGAILLWHVLRRLNIGSAWLCAAIFALHPLNVESVAFVSELKNVLCGVFFFSSILLFLRMLDEPETVELTPVENKKSETGEDDEEVGPPMPLRTKLYFAALALFACAVLSKTIAASMPAVMLVLMWWKGRKITNKRLMELVPFFVIGIVLGLVTAHLERVHVGARGPEWNLSILDRTLIAGRALWFYPMKLVMPIYQSFVYDRWPTPMAIWNVVFVLGFIAVIGLLWMKRRDWGRGPLAAVVIYAGTLFPALGFFNIYPMRYSFVADHYQYLSGVALIVLAVEGIRRLVARTGDYQSPAGRAWRIGPPAVLLVVLGFASWMHANVFVDDITLWSATLKRNTVSPLPRTNLASALLAEANDMRNAARQATRVGESDQAAEFQKTADDNTQTAQQLYDEALKLDPKSPEARIGKGNLALDRREFDQALIWYDEAIDLNRKLPNAWLGKANALLSLDRPAAALEAAEESVKLRAMSARGHFIAGKALLILARQSPVEQKDEYGKKALDRFALAVNYNPDLVEARFEFGKLLRQYQYYRDAINQLTVVVKMDPGNAVAFNELGWTAGERSAGYREQAELSRKSGDTVSQQNYQAMEQEDIKLALSCFRAALEIDPSLAEAKKGLAAVEAARLATSQPTTTPSATQSATQSSASTQSTKMP